MNMSSPRACQSFALALLVVVGPSTAEGPKPAADIRLVLEEFDVARDGYHLLLPVTFKGKKYRFVVDTGATVNCYDPSLPLGKPKGEVATETLDGCFRIPFYHPPDAAVGSLGIRSDLPVLGFDMKPFREAAIGYEVYGILGMDFLRNHVIRIDFDTGKLTFLREAGREPGQAVPLTFDRGNRPSVVMEIAGWGREEFVVDTGYCKSGSGLLRHELFESLRTKRKLKEVGHEYFQTLGGSQGRLGQVLGISVGELQVREPVFGARGDANLLGLGYLARYTVTFDFPRKIMYLKKGRRFRHPERWDWTGLSFKRVDGKLTVRSLAKDSPAATSGFRPGDVIFEVEGRVADRMSISALLEALRFPRKEVRIRVRRGEKDMEVTLVLKAEAPMSR
jgi:hypothetical protein